MKPIAIAVLALLLAAAPARAGTIYESATLGPVGEGAGYALGSVGGFTEELLGSPFSVGSTVQVTDIGGNMDCTSGDLFGAIISLSGPSAIPPGKPFIGPEIVASTVFDPGYPSSDFLTPLSATLTPGSYAVIFGSGYLGASGTGAMPIDNTVLPGVSFFSWNIQPPTDWDSFSGIGLRFAVTGTVVPEPNSLALAVSAGIGLTACGRRRRRTSRLAGASTGSPFAR